MLFPKTAAEKQAWFAGWTAAASGISRSEYPQYATLEECQAFDLGWNKRIESLDTSEEEDLL